MTLILNEIHVVDGLRETFIIAAADSVISNQDGTFNSIRRKLFKIHYLNGAISYFGLAGFYHQNLMNYLSDWLPSFIQSHVFV